MQGSIRGNSVTFQAASHVEGDVFHRKLAIEQGAYFEGKSRRSEDPMAVQRTPTAAPRGRGSDPSRRRQFEVAIDDARGLTPHSRSRSLRIS